MQVKFTQPYLTPQDNYKAGDVIEAETRSEDQITRWLNRGLVEPVTEDETRTADIKQPRKRTKE